MLGKLMGIASIGEALAGLSIARKFVIDLAIIVMLTIIAAMVAGWFAIGCLYECNAVLVRHGLDPDMAALFTGLLALLVLAVLGGIIYYRINRMQSSPFNISRMNFPGKSVQSVLHGFYKGLMAKR